MASRSVETLPVYSPDRLPEYTVELTIDAGRSSLDSEWESNLLDSARTATDRDISKTPAEGLGFFTVLCLVLNRMIGTEICYMDLQHSF